MRIEFIGPEAERVVPVGGRARLCQRHTAIEVPNELGARLCEQRRIWREAGDDVPDALTPEQKSQIEQDMRDEAAAAVDVLASSFHSEPEGLDVAPGEESERQGLDVELGEEVVLNTHPEPLPDDFPGVRALRKAGIVQYDQVPGTVRNLTAIPGIGEATARQIMDRLVNDHEDEEAADVRSS